MGYRSLIDRNLVLAFKAAKDLIVQVVLTKKASSYDFGTATVSTTSTEKSSVDALWIDKRKSDKTSMRQIMLQRKDIDDINTYDTLTQGSEVWKINSPIKDDGFIAILEVYKE